MQKDTDARLRFFLKTAGGPTAVSKKTGIHKSTISNIIRKGSRPSFDVTTAIFKVYPALNYKWLFFGEDPMWLEKPTNIDDDFSDLILVEDPKVNYKTKVDYSTLEKEQLLRIITEKDAILNSLIHEKNKIVSLLERQLKVQELMLQQIDKQGAT